MNSEASYSPGKKLKAISLQQLQLLQPNTKYFLTFVSRTQTLTPALKPLPIFKTKHD